MSETPSAAISPMELAELKRLCGSKGIYWKLADYHYDARLSPNVVLKLIYEIERLEEALYRATHPHSRPGHACAICQPEKFDGPRPRRRKVGAVR